MDRRACICCDEAKPLRWRPVGHMTEVLAAILAAERRLHKHDGEMKASGEPDLAPHKSCVLRMLATTHQNTKVGMRAHTTHTHTRTAIQNEVGCACLNQILLMTL